MWRKEPLSPAIASSSCVCGKERKLLLSLLIDCLQSFASAIWGQDDNPPRGWVSGRFRPASIFRASQPPNDTPTLARSGPSRWIVFLSPNCAGNVNKNGARFVCVLKIEGCKQSSLLRTAIAPRACPFTDIFLIFFYYHFILSPRQTASHQATAQCCR